MPFPRSNTDIDDQPLADAHAGVALTDVILAEISPGTSPNARSLERSSDTRRYTGCMTTQIAVKLPDAVVATIDDLVAQGRFDSRSAAVRAGLDMVTRHARDDAIDRAVTDGFRRFPESPQELRDAHRLAIDAIEEEPWEPWW